MRLTTLLYPAQTKPYMAEKVAHIQTAVCAQSELQHYTTALPFIWPTAHHSPKLWFPRSQHVSWSTPGLTLTTPAFHLGFPKNSAEEDSHVFAWQTSRSSPSTRHCLPTLVCIHRVLMQHTDWAQSKAKQICESLFAAHAVPVITDKTSSMVTQLELVQTLGVFLPSLISPRWNGQKISK